MKTFILHLCTAWDENWKRKFLFVLTFCYFNFYCWFFSIADSFHLSSLCFCASKFSCSTSQITSYNVYCRKGKHEKNRREKLFVLPSNVQSMQMCLQLYFYLVILSDSSLNLFYYVHVRYCKWNWLDWLTFEAHYSDKIVNVSEWLEFHIK